MCFLNPFLGLREGRSDAAAAGHGGMVTPDTGGRGDSKVVAGARAALIRQGLITQRAYPAVSCLPEQDGNQINKLSQLVSPHSHSVYLVLSLLSLLLPSHMKKAKLFVYLPCSPL